MRDLIGRACPQCKTGTFEIEAHTGAQNGEPEMLRCSTCAYPAPRYAADTPREKRWDFENARPEDFCMYDGREWIILWIADGFARIKSVVGMQTVTVNVTDIQRKGPQ